jgi:hypothetical protein
MGNKTPEYINHSGNCGGDQGMFQKNSQNTTGAAKDTTPAGNADDGFKKMYNQVHVRVPEIPGFIMFVKTAPETPGVKNSL